MCGDVDNYIFVLRTFPTNEDRCTMMNKVATTEADRSNEDGCIKIISLSKLKISKRHSLKLLLKQKSFAGAKL